jgi:MFS family permease
MSTTVQTTLDSIELRSLSLAGTSHEIGKANALPEAQAHYNKASDGPLAEDVVYAGKRPSTLRVTLTILQPSFVNFLTSFTNGLITVGLPAIARDIHLARTLYLWPSSVYGLTSGSILLLAGAVADLIGAKKVELVGCVLVGIFTLACGFAQTGIQLVLFRAIQGIAVAMHLPSSVSIVASAVPSGRPRNIGYACLGASQVLGFSTGLVASGVMVDRIGWRPGFYISGGALLATAFAAFRGLPSVAPSVGEDDTRSISRKLYDEVDWVGGVMASAGLALLSYVLAALSADLNSIKSPLNATLLPLSVVLMAAFPLWMNYRQKHGKPALVPNSLWRNTTFASTCLMVLLSYGVMNSMELFSSLYYQEIQDASALTSSLQFLPSMTVGCVLNLTVGAFIHKVPARWLVTVSSILCAGAPLLMALVNPAWSYWYLEFWAQVLAPMSADILFTVGLIIISDVFPEKTQGLAGGVFNTTAQFGFSLGTGICQLVALGVAGSSSGGGSHGSSESSDVDPKALLEGYRASFWTMFAFMLACALLAVFGLRKAGTVGLKRD